MTDADPFHGGEAERPDIIWVLLDACRPDFFCYGNPRPVSPHIDALAEEGCLFESHFAQGLWTKASVPSYMTGKYFPVSCLDFMDYGSNANCPRAVPEDEILLPLILRDNGYHTVLVSAQVYISPRSRLYNAFDEAHVFSPTDGSAYVDVEQMMESINGILATPREQPLFLYIHIMDTHFPHILKAPFNQWVDPAYKSDAIAEGQPIQKKGNHFTAEDKAMLRALHDGSILASDDAVGDLMDTLKKQGRYDKTLFVIGADHGDALGEDGEIWGHEDSCDEVAQVPLIFKGPGISEGSRIDAFTENVDIVPTVIDLLDLKTNAKPDGKSLMPLIRGQEDSLHDYVFTRWYSCGYDKPNGFIIRDQKYKYEYNPVDNYEALYSVPDALASRVPCAAVEKDTIAFYQNLRKDIFEQKWNAYDALEKLYHDFRFTQDFLNDQVSTADLIEIESAMEPETALAWGNKWKWMNDLLWAAPWMGDASPLQFRCEVPPGRYLLTLYLPSITNMLDHPASMLRVRCQSDTHLSEIKYAMKYELEYSLGLVEAGVVDVPDGRFEMEVQTGDTPYWSVIGGFRLTLAETVEAAADMPDDEQLQDQLRALGYL
ncbi:MAG: sulfatase [Candidatus Hydrogenedentes bacterium]|nr:sulfatase [Candidatus Hydrogenedentota bacterium]